MKPSIYLSIYLGNRGNRVGPSSQSACYMTSLFTIPMLGTRLCTLSLQCYWLPKKGEPSLGPLLCQRIPFFILSIRHPLSGCLDSDYAKVLLLCSACYVDSPRWAMVLPFSGIFFHVPQLAVLGYELATVIALCGAGSWQSLDYLAWVRASAG